MTAPSAAFAAAVADRYTIERLLGAGGMAHVWLARDLRHDRRVALKVLRQDLGAVAGSERFLAEIRTTAQLVHPHILPLLDSGESGGLYWFASPYVEGETLRARLRRETQLPVADAVRIASEIASALDAAHRRGIVHRDVKPENILFQDGAALVADFGIALAVSDADGARLTETGTSLGTPHYMSPEQAAGDRQLDTRTDIYALGAVLYEMLTGEPPHSGATAQAVLAKVISEDPTRVRTVRPTVSPALEAVVHRALAKTPADRFRSAGDMVAALSAPDIVTPSSGTPARARRDRRARRRAAGLVVVVIAIVAGVASWPFVRRPKPGAVPLAAGAPRIQLTRGGKRSCARTDTRWAARGLCRPGLRLGRRVPLEHRGARHCRGREHADRDGPWERRGFVLVAGRPMAPGSDKYRRRVGHVRGASARRLATLHRVLLWKLSRSR